MLIGLTQHHQQNTHGNDMSSWATGENRRFSEGVEGSSHRFDCSCSKSAKILRLRWRSAQNDKLVALCAFLTCWVKSICILYYFTAFSEEMQVSIPGQKIPGPCGPGKFRYVGEESYFFRDSSTATATETVMPTMGLLPAPRKPRKLRLRFGKHLK